MKKRAKQGGGIISKRVEDMTGNKRGRELKVECSTVGRAQWGGASVLALAPGASL